MNRGTIIDDASSPPEALSALKQGITLRKLSHRAGRQTLVTVSVSEDLTELRWGSKSAPTSSIVDVLVGT